MRATLVGVVVIYSCSSLKTYYSEFTPPSDKPVVQDQASVPHQPAQHTAGVQENPAPSTPEAASTPAESERARAAAAEAAAASAAALKASQQAAKAAAEASMAAARAAGTPSPSAQPTPAPPMLSSSDQSDQSERQHVADRIDGLNRSIQSIDRQRLSADGQSRTKLGEQFLRSAQKAYAEGSYSEAAGLADKASMMISPLVETPPAKNP